MVLEIRSKTIYFVRYRKVKLSYLITYTYLDNIMNPFEKNAQLIQIEITIKVICLNINFSAVKFTRR